MTEQNNQEQMTQTKENELNDLIAYYINKYNLDDEIKVHRVNDIQDTDMNFSMTIHLDKIQKKLSNELPFSKRLFLSSFLGFATIKSFLSSWEIISLIGVSASFIGVFIYYL